jgi:hypothetical protein
MAGVNHDIVTIAYLGFLYIHMCHWTTNFLVSVRAFSSKLPQTTAALHFVARTLALARLSGTCTSDVNTCVVAIVDGRRTKNNIWGVTSVFTTLV